MNTFGVSLSVRVHYVYTNYGGWGVRLVIMILALVLLATGASSSDETDFKRTLELMKPLSVRSMTWRCVVTSKHICSKTGCERGKFDPSVYKNKVQGPLEWVDLSLDGRTYNRCDPDGCDMYATSVSSGGLYTTVQLVGRGASIKIVNDGSSFVDTATSGTAAFVRFGKCEPR